jgi:hypothetical protein
MGRSTIVAAWFISCWFSAVRSDGLTQTLEHLIAQRIRGVNEHFRAVSGKFVGQDVDV